MMNDSSNFSVIELQKQEIRWELVINPSLAVLYIYYLVRLAFKHRHHFEPVHVFELTTLADMTFGILCNVRIKRQQIKDIKINFQLLMNISIGV